MTMIVAWFWYCSIFIFAASLHLLLLKTIIWLTIKFANFLQISELEDLHIAFVLCSILSSNFYFNFNKSSVTGIISTLLNLLLDKVLNAIDDTFIAQLFNTVHVKIEGHPTFVSFPRGYSTLQCSTFFQSLPKFYG